MLQPLLLMIVAFYCLFTCALLLNMRSELLRRAGSTQWVRTLVTGERRAI
jgi:heme exporter protein C